MKHNATVGVVSLGCSKNLVDTEQMLGLLRAAGFTLVKKPEEAEVLIVNTCGFITSAKEESIDTILEMAAYKEKGRCHTLVVTGCLAQRYKEALQKELPEVDFFLGVHEYGRLIPLLCEGENAPENTRRFLSTPFYTGYLRIADGCNNRCTYCAIPLIRGTMHAEPMEGLLEEARRMCDNGVTELTLIAQDTSGYGMDLYGKPMLLPLMEALCKIDALRFLRVLYTYPDTVTPALIAGMAGNEKICNYLDMPLQHINDAILKRMHRRGDRAHIQRVLDYIRENAPDFILRTTMMVGFPGETEEDFRELMDFIRAYPFDRLGAFAFSPEEDTPAAQMPGQIEEDVKQQRLGALLAAQRGISLDRNRARVGKEALVLIENVEGGQAIGRSYAEAPEVDGKILLQTKPWHAPGVYVNARITGAMEYDLTAEDLG